MDSTDGEMLIQQHGETLIRQLQDELKRVEAQRDNFKDHADTRLKKIEELEGRLERTMIAFESMTIRAESAEAALHRLTADDER